MPKFSKRSKDALATCHPKLQQIFEAVILHFDCSVIEGHRDEIRQNYLADVGRSKARWPNGKHNAMPSGAADVVPYPIDWNDRERFHYFAGFVLATALSLGIGLRWGGDWDQDTEVDDNRFDDLPHYELIKES